VVGRKASENEEWRNLNGVAKNRFYLYFACCPTWPCSRCCDAY